MTDLEKSESVYLCLAPGASPGGIRSRIAASLAEAGIPFSPTEGNNARDLEEMNGEIQRCSAVFCFSGAEKGDSPHPDASAAFLRKINEPGKPFLAGTTFQHGGNDSFSRFSFQQWELLLAIHHGLPVYSFVKLDSTFWDGVQAAQPSARIHLLEDDEEIHFTCLKELADFFISHDHHAPAASLYLRVLDFFTGKAELELGNDLGVILAGERKYEPAELLFRKVRDLKNQVLGEDDPSTLGTLDNLVEVLRMKGDFEESRRLADEAMGNRTPRFGEYHPDTLASLKNRALLLEFDESEKLLTDGAAASRASLGADHPTTLQLLANLADVLHARGEYEEAGRLRLQIGETSGEYWENPPESLHIARPHFVVGVVGHMNIPPQEEASLAEKIRSIYCWLKSDRFPEDEFGFGEPLGLDDTRILLLSSLAPGADQLAARIALEEDIAVRCPLPFPIPLYRQATTFKRGSVAGTMHRQRQFDELVKEIGPQNTFTVGHVDDLRENTPPLHVQLVDREQRNRRYRAAGEYVAAHCDLLITIADQEDAIEAPEWDPNLSRIAQCGTRVILTSYINGIEPGILPYPPSLSWQENGPAIRIFCPNQTRPRETHCQPGDIVIWHPADAKDPGKLHEQIHQIEMDDLRLVADRLEKLNDDFKRIPETDSTIAQMFAKGPTYRPTTTWDRLIEAGKIFEFREAYRNWLDRLKSFLPGMREEREDRRLPPLERLVEFANRVESSAGRYSKQVTFLTNTPFVMGFVVFLIFEFNRIVGLVALPNEKAWAASSFILAALFLISGILFHSWAKGWGAFDRKNDYRALSVGARVQFYWAAAGISERVPSNYVQRISGEISWIKSALSSVLIPLEAASRNFDSLASFPERCGRLRQVWQGWVCNVENYFSRESDHYTKLHNRLGLWGNLFLSASAFLFIISFAHKWAPNGPLIRISDPIFEVLKLWGLLLWTLAAAALFYGSQWIVSRAYAATYDRREPDWSMTILSNWKKFDNKLTRIIAGLTLGFVIYSALHSFFSHSHAEQSIHSHAAAAVSELEGERRQSHEHGGDETALFETAVGFVKNMLLTLGGLLLSYSLVKFTGENSRRYQGMRGQFRSAKAKIERLLNRYESLVEKHREESDVEESRPKLEEEMKGTEKAIQELLIVLGRESLHENTEWLLMRRNRPVEPIAAPK